MPLTQDQISTLQKKLVEQKEKLTDVLASLKAGDPAENSSRINDNADIGTDARESSDLIEYESLERETTLMLDATNSALERIMAGTYGVTDDGEDIPYDRLLVDPTATTTL